MFGINTLFQALFEFVFTSLVGALNALLAEMNGMGVETVELAWVQALIRFFGQLGWALFLAGAAVSIFDTAIEAQNGKPAYREAAINLIKGFMAVSLFTTVPVELFKACVSLQGSLADAICQAFSMTAFEGIGAIAIRLMGMLGPLSPVNVLVIVMMAYCVIKCFFQNIKRGGILVINIAVGSLYMLSVPRGYMDGFVGWCKQVAALCLTTVLQTTLLTAGLLTCMRHPLLGVGLMLSANEVPRIAERFGLDTSAKLNVMGGVQAANTIMAMAKGIASAPIK